MFPKEKKNEYKRTDILSNRPQPAARDDPWIF